MFYWHSRRFSFYYPFFLLSIGINSPLKASRVHFSIKPNEIKFDASEQLRVVPIKVSTSSDIVLKKNFIKFFQKRSGSVEKIPFSKTELKKFYSYVGFDAIFGEGGEISLKKGEHVFNVPMHYSAAFEKDFPFVFQLGFSGLLSEKQSKSAVNIVTEVEKFFYLKTKKKPVLPEDLAVEKVTFIPQEKECSTLDSSLFLKRIRVKERPLSCFNYIAIRISSKSKSYILARPYAHLYHKILQKKNRTKKELHLFYHQKYFAQGDLTKSFFLIYPDTKVDIVLPLFKSYLQGQYLLDLYFQKGQKTLAKKTVELTLRAPIKRSYDSPGNISWEGVGALKTGECYSKIEGQSFPKFCPFSANLKGSFTEDVFVSPDDQISVDWGTRGKVLFSFSPDDNKNKWRIFKGELIINEKAQVKLPHYLRFKVFGRQGFKTKVRKIPIKVATF